MNFDKKEIIQTSYMLKIYLDWNVITHLKDETNTELYSYIVANKDKFIFPYSAAHLKDLFISKNHKDEYEQDLHLLSDICEHHLLEHEQNINNPYPYKCYPEEFIDIKGQDIEVFNSGFSKDSFFKNLESKGIDPKVFMSLLEEKEVEPLEIPFIDRTICNYADIFSVLFEYGPQIFNSKELPKLIQKSIQGATDKDVYKDIQGAKSGNIFRKLDEITVPQIGESFSGMIETVLADRSQSNLDLFTTLYIALNMSGFFADKKRNLQNIYTDSEHAYYASSCDIFVSDDKRLREKTSAIYSEKGIRTFVVSTSELISLMNEELSKSYDIEFMFNTALKTYGVPIREEGENKVYGQLPFHFLGLFNFCIKLNLPKVDLTIGEFRCNVPQRGYVFYTELERFFNLVLKVINNKEQRSLFQQEFVSKFLTTNKDIVNTATFTIDCPGYLIQLAADKWSHLPLPILFITKKAETEMDSQETINVSGDAPSNVAPPKKKKKKKKRRKKQNALQMPQDSRLFTIPHDALIPYEKDIKERMASNTHKGLIDNLQKVFSEEELLHVIDLYRLGSVDHRWMVYPYIDIENRLRMMKTIRYYVDGHRAQSKSGVSSLHALLKEEAILPAQWEEHNCIFGEHLLPINPDKPVVVVESEKTAIVCTMLMPSYIWLATGGCDRFRYLETIKELLNARTTYILPDKGQYNNWCKAARKHKIQGKVLDYIEKMEVERNTDIADLLLSDKREEYLKDFVECLSTDK